MNEGLENQVRRVIIGLAGIMLFLVVFFTVFGQDSCDIRLGTPSLQLNKSTPFVAPCGLRFPELTGPGSYDINDPTVKVGS